MHQVTKLVKVGDLPPDERRARGLADMPDTMEVPIVIEEIVTDSAPSEPKPIELKEGQRRQSVRGFGKEPKTPKTEPKAS